MLYLDRDGAWHASLDVTSPYVFWGEERPIHASLWNVQPARKLRAHSTTLTWLNRHPDLRSVADRLLAGDSRSREWSWNSELLAVMTYAVAGDVETAKEVLSAQRGLTPPDLAAAERLAVRLGVELSSEALAPADLSWLAATLTRAISGDLDATAARALGRRWLARGGIVDPALTVAVEALSALPEPESGHVPAWQRDLEEVRAWLRAASALPWPNELPGVGDIGGWRVRDRQAEKLDGRRFTRHAFYCPDGVPPGGRERLEVFADCSAFPVWVRGGSCMAGPRWLKLSPDLAADLWSWGNMMEAYASERVSSSGADVVRGEWRERIELLATRLESETGSGAVIGDNHGRGDGSCPTEGCYGPAR